jgi:heterogeneous nuclear ribonucleoprotein R
VTTETKTENTEIVNTETKSETTNGVESEVNTDAVKTEESTNGTSEETVIESNETKKETATPTPAPIVAPIVAPPSGCECFVGKLPRDLFEDELIPVFEKYGRIWDLRLMIDPSSGYSKGYCFVTYCEKTDAQTAAKALNDFEIRQGKEMRVNISVANIKLFIGNIPKTKTKEELKTEFTKIVEGLAEVIIYHQGETENDKVKNRGFCFLEFIDHKSASVAKRKLGSSRFNRVFNREIAVDWADPNDEPDEETMSKVKVLYVKNLSADVTEEEVQKVFEAYGKLERVRKMKDYAFVHFDQRDDAVKAMEEQNTKVIGKLPMEISLARPLTDKKKQAQQKRLEGNNHRGNHNGNNNGNNFRNNNRNFNRKLFHY